MPRQPVLIPGSLRDQVAHPVADRDLDGEIGVAVEKRAEARREHEVAERGVGVDAKPAWG